MVKCMDVVMMPIQLCFLVRLSYLANAKENLRLVSICMSYIYYKSLVSICVCIYLSVQALQLADLLKSLYLKLHLNS